MIKIIGCLIGFVLLDLYYFPIEFFEFPGINTKMMLATLGGIVLVFDMVRHRNFTLSSDTIELIGYSLLVSFIGLISTLINETSDYAYATYTFSAATWFFGAYLVTRFLSSIHPQFRWTHLCHYLVAVCAFQCIIAEVINLVPAVKNFINTYVNQGQDFLEDVERLYGIGASLDVAGVRFSVVLVLMFFFLSNEEIPKKNVTFALYTFALVIIAGIGNIIARTTTVGLLLGLSYFLWVSIRQGATLKGGFLKVWAWLGVVLAIIIPVTVILYNTDPSFYKSIRFGFEGFFSLVEKGRWEVGSNEQLKSMYVYPEALKTWIIGDGYFSSPRTDPHFLGKDLGGYYMGTDVGFLRFIFYFGVTGLLAFSLFLIKAAWVCQKKIPNSKVLFFFFFVANCVIWLKVSTDVFLILALFLSLPKQTDSIDY